eukprot:bmy_16403T0
MFPQSRHPGESGGVDDNLARSSPAAAGEPLSLQPGDPGALTATRPGGWKRLQVSLEASDLGGSTFPLPRVKRKLDLKLECEKLASEKTEMQRHYVMYYEMSYGLNIEMHKQSSEVHNS